jgi:hypothetical protein
MNALCKIPDTTNSLESLRCTSVVQAGDEKEPVFWKKSHLQKALPDSILSRAQI